MKPDARIGSQIWLLVCFLLLAYGASTGVAARAFAIDAPWRVDEKIPVDDPDRRLILDLVRPNDESDFGVKVKLIVHDMRYTGPFAYLDASPAQENGADFSGLVWTDYLDSKCGDKLRQNRTGRSTYLLQKLKGGWSVMAAARPCEDSDGHRAILTRFYDRIGLSEGGRALRVLAAGEDHRSSSQCLSRIYRNGFVVEFMSADKKIMMFFSSDETNSERFLAGLTTNDGETVSAGWKRGPFVADNPKATTQYIEKVDTGLVIVDIAAFMATLSKSSALLLSDRDNEALAVLPTSGLKGQIEFIQRCAAGSLPQ